MAVEDPYFERAVHLEGNIEELNCLSAVDRVPERVEIPEAYQGLDLTFALVQAPDA